MVLIIYLRVYSQAGSPDCGGLRAASEGGFGRLLPRANSPQSWHGRRMTDVRQMILDAAVRIFADGFPKQELARAARGEWLAAQWHTISSAGLPLALVDESAGGAGVEIDAALGLVELAGRHVVPLPLVDTMLANHLLAQSG